MSKIKDVINKRIKQLSGSKYVEVGFMSDAKYPDGTKVAEVAFINEYGDPLHNIPARPFMRQTISKNKSDWIKNIYSSISSGKDISQSLSFLGEKIVGDIQDSIINFSDPPNAPYTIQKKGFNDPLVETGNMIKSVTKRVVK